MIYYSERPKSHTPLATSLKFSRYKDLNIRILAHIIKIIHIRQNLIDKNNVNNHHSWKHYSMLINDLQTL